MTRDAGAKKIVALLEAPSTELEAATAALAAALETAHGSETRVVQLPQTMLGPIARLQNYYRGLHRQVENTESGNAAGRNAAAKALTRMEEGLKSLADAVHMEGEEAGSEAKLAAAAMSRASGELEAAIGKLG